MAERIARDFEPGSCVNLGIGMPTAVAAHLKPTDGVVVTSENGLIGIGPPPVSGEEDPDSVDAGKKPVTLMPGAAIVHQADSFALIRGGRLDVAVLGAFQVSEEGDLASWRLPAERIGSVGGAMDIAVGARLRYVIMNHRDKSGRPKIVTRCNYPLTARRCVNRIYSDLAVIDVTERGLIAREIHPGLSLAELVTLTEAPIRREPLEVEAHLHGRRSGDSPATRG
jgi:3-oxoadipate CoA-transferase beta subunit